MISGWISIAIGICFYAAAWVWADVMMSPKLMLTEEYKKKAEEKRKKMPKWYRNIIERIEERIIKQ